MIYIKDTQDPQTIYIDGKGQAVEKTGTSPLKLNITSNGSYNFNASSEGLKGYNPVNVNVNVGLKGMVGQPYLSFSFRGWKDETFPSDKVINLNGARAGDTAFGDNNCKEIDLTNIGLEEGNYLTVNNSGLFREAREVVRISDFNVRFNTDSSEARWNDFFSGCRKLEVLPHIHFSTTRKFERWGNQAYSMFWNCLKLKRIENLTFDDGMYLSRFNTWIGGDWDSYQGDYPLEYMQAFPCFEIEEQPNIFEKLPEGNKLTYFGGFTGLKRGHYEQNKVFMNNAQHLSAESLNDIINNLAQAEKREESGTYPVISFNTECEARMSDDLKALAVSKNWTVEFGDRM